MRRIIYLILLLPSLCFGGVKDLIAEPENIQKAISLKTKILPNFSKKMISSLGNDR